MAYDKPTDEDEAWRDVVGYEGLYEVSNLARVRSLAHQIPHGRWKGFVRTSPGKLRNPRYIGPGKKKYLSIDLCKDGNRKSVKVHRLVLEAFVGPCPLGWQACHYDGDTANNCLSNLRWDTPRNNNADKIRHGTNVGNRGNSCGVNHPRAKLTEQEVFTIRDLWQEGFSTYWLAKRYGVGKQSIRLLVHRITWRRLCEL